MKGAKMDIEDKLQRKNIKLAKEEEDKKEEESAKFMKYFDLCCLLLPIIAALWQWLASFIW
ncbi:hypothetical protein HMPREF0813_02002 [Streptococcus anginosus F0211]|jgi:hypothetical protein|uniref:Uncharacterized protein n=2 Tax=Streptococcus TaxID=1301 RepID=E6J3Z9_STRAP|nr:hypothetical protein HMPREF0813_02002 [Streptococcus anginosus F0211]